MEFFHRARAVRLKSQHRKFLAADEDEETIKQRTNGSSPDTRWTVEFVEGKPNLIRLKSSQSWKYLSASEGNSLLGLTGNKVTQASPRMKFQPSVEWEPIKDGLYLKLRTSSGRFLKANGQLWRYSVTHDLPSTTATQDWVYWVVDILEFVDHSKSAEDDVVEKNVVEDGGVSRSSSVGSSGGGGATASPTAGSVNSSRAPPPSFTTVGDSVRRQNSVGKEAPNSPTPKPGPAARQDEYRPTRFSPPIFDDEPMKPVNSPTRFATPPTRVPPPPAHHTLNNNETKNSSGSSHKLNSLLGDMQNIIDQKISYGYTQEFEEDTIILEQQQLPVEVQRAKQTLKDIRNEDFKSSYYTGLIKKAEKAITTLLSYNYHLKPQTQAKLQRFHDQIQTLKVNHDTAFTNLDDYEKYTAKRSDMRVEVQQDAAKARELQNVEQEYLGFVTAARKKREDLLRQLAEVDAEIKMAEGKVRENEEKIEELCGVIGRKKDTYMKLENQEKMWQEKKSEAKRMIRHVERQWGDMKIGFQLLE